ncbi:CzcN domain-containing protein [Hyphomicrobium nitrativorans NL23]|uniref:CzcN domain-containing protein n=1 Tax=Hyphomicrobium nitrativorans NL23 TaxID=1029756 RepID=V5SD61_9HYPH|nr:isoprenylcysteine carboxylmethyltransferase family protein [Hyphomicrobium nitrativorans]AHB48468.1 CzcN domain-containing protein [Hyphomicrobium nitrativorans NL23]
MDVIFSIGLVAGVVLNALLVVTRFSRLQIWPCPETWSAEQVSFWTLFRVTNVAALAIILFGITPGLFEVPVRIAAAAFGIVCSGFYLFACLELGRENLYCGSAGLKVRGIYRWSRNPQYATAIPGYLAGSVAAGTVEALVLAAVVSLVFFQMAMLEDRWLKETYGASFDAYRQRVSRFYNVRRVRSLGRSARRKARAVLRHAALDATGARRSRVPARRNAIRQRFGR